MTSGEHIYTIYSLLINWSVSRVWSHTQTHYSKWRRAAHSSAYWNSPEHTETSNLLINTAS